MSRETRWLKRPGKLFDVLKITKMSCVQYKEGLSWSCLKSQKNVHLHSMQFGEDIEIL